VFFSYAAGQGEAQGSVVNIPLPQGVQAPFTAAEWINDHGGLLLASEAGLYEWNVPNGPRATPTSLLAEPTKALFNSQVERVFDLKRSPNQEWIAIAGGRPGESGMLEVWRIRDQQLLHRWEIEGDVVYQIDWSGNNRRLAAASAIGVCSVFDVERKTEVVQYKGHSSGVTTISVMQDDRTVVSGAIDQTIHLWSLETGEGIRVLDNHTAPVRCLIQGPPASDTARGTILSASEDRTVRLWQPQLGRLVRFAKLPSGVSAMEAFANGAENTPSPPSPTIVVGCDDGSLHRIAVDTMKSEQMKTHSLGRIYRLLRYFPPMDKPPQNGLIVIATKGAFVSYGQN
jgi:WD40 repeat protein